MGGQLARGFCLMQTLEQADVAAPALPRRAYPGLRPFTLDEDLVFFGREPMIDDIIDLLAKRCLILVHGSSGSGKSSLILAGVCPASPASTAGTVGAGARRACARAAGRCGTWPTHSPNWRAGRPQPRAS